MGEAKRKRMKNRGISPPSPARERQDEIQWHPIERMDLVVEVLRGMVDESREALPTYRQIRAGTLDRPLVERMKRSFAERVELLDIHRQQLARWRKESPTPVQLRKIEEGEALVEEGTQLNRAFLEMAERAVPIEDIMGMSDFEIGLRALSGDLPDPGEPLLREPPPVARPVASSSTEGDAGDEDVPGIQAFRAALTEALEEYMGTVDRWAGEVAGAAAPLPRALGRRVAETFLKKLHEKTVDWDVEGTRVANRMLSLQDWTLASDENRRFFIDGVVNAPDAEHSRGAMREIARELGLAAEEGDEMARLMDASARLTFGEAFPPGEA